MRGRKSIHLSTNGTGELEDVQSNIQERLQERHNKVNIENRKRCRFCKNAMTRTSVRSRRHLAEVGVKVHHAVAELLHVLRQELVCVGYPIIQVSHFVVGESPEARRVVLRDRKDQTLGRRQQMGASNQRAAAAILTAGTRRTASSSAAHET